LETAAAKEINNNFGKYELQHAGKGLIINLKKKKKFSNEQRQDTFSTLQSVIQSNLP